MIYFRFFCYKSIDFQRFNCFIISDFYCIISVLSYLYNYSKDSVYILNLTLIFDKK